MSKHPWPKSARAASPIEPAPHVRCWECVAKEEQLNRLMVEYQRLVREVIAHAADLAVAEGPEVDCG
jgi:hypothetical protein